MRNQDKVKQNVIVLGNMIILKEILNNMQLHFINYENVAKLPKINSTYRVAFLFHSKWFNI